MPFANVNVNVKCKCVKQVIHIQLKMLTGVSVSSVLFLLEMTNQGDIP